VCVHVCVVCVCGCVCGVCVCVCGVCVCVCVWCVKKYSSFRTDMNFKTISLQACCVEMMESS